MATCDDCQGGVVWLKRPDGSGYLPPLEPTSEFAYGDYFMALPDGTATIMPQVYRRHVCPALEGLTNEQVQERRRARVRTRVWNEAQREQEREQLLVEAARMREQIAQSERQAQIDAVYDEAWVMHGEWLAGAEDRERERQERKAHECRLKIRAREREVTAALGYARARVAHLALARLLPYPCRDCGAERDEPCRAEYWGTKANADRFWEWRSMHTARYVDGPPAARVHREYWGEDYEPQLGRGTTPETCGPWPPAANDGGRYDMAHWLTRHYQDVFDPDARRKTHWMSDAEEAKLTDWLEAFGSMFEAKEEGGVDPGGVAPDDRQDRGAEGVRRDEAGAREASDRGEVRAS